MARESLVRVGMEEAMHREISGYSLECGNGPSWLKPSLAIPNG